MTKGDNAGLRKARRVRRLIAEGHTKTEARRIAGVKGKSRKSTRKHGKRCKC